MRQNCEKRRNKVLQKINDQRVEMFNSIAKTKRRAKSAKRKSALYLKGETMHQKDNGNPDEAESLSNYFEEQKAREEIWEKYTKRNMSMAMKAAYAELYPEIYGKDAPNTSELLKATDPFDTYDSQNNHDQSNGEFHEDLVEINSWDRVTGDTKGDSSPEQDIESRSLDDIAKRERQAQYENEKLESELIRLSSREKIYEETRGIKYATNDDDCDQSMAEENNLNIRDNVETESTLASEKPAIHLEAGPSNEGLFEDRSYEASNDLDFKHQGSVMTNAQIRVSKKLVNADAVCESDSSKRNRKEADRKDKANTDKSIEKQDLIKRFTDNETDREKIAEEDTAESVIKVHKATLNPVEKNESLTESVDREAKEYTSTVVDCNVISNLDERCGCSVDTPTLQDVPNPTVTNINTVEVGAIPKETPKLNINTSTDGKQQLKSQTTDSNREHFPAEKLEDIAIINNNLNQDAANISNSMQKNSKMTCQSQHHQHTVCPIW